MRQVYDRVGPLGGQSTGSAGPNGEIGQSRPAASTAAMGRWRRPASPSAWFLPGPVRMRGGTARRFASDRYFHRGSQAESTWRKTHKETSIFQRLRESRSGQAGFFCGIHLRQSAEATWWKPATPEATPDIQIALHIRAAPTGRGTSQARPEYLARRPSSRAMRSSPKSPDRGVGFSMARTKNCLKSWR